MRQNVGARPIIGDARYPFRIGIAIPFKLPREDGMPGEDEFDIFVQIEDVIYDYFDTDRAGILCFIITTQGMREFIVYSKTGDITDLIASLTKQFPAYDFQHYAEQDKGWEVYKQWDA